MTMKPRDFSRCSQFIAHSPLAAVFAVEKIAHGFTPGGVGAFVALPLIARYFGVGRFFFTARRTPVGKSRLPRFQLELFSTRHTCFDWVRHGSIIRRRSINNPEAAPPFAVFEGREDGTS